MFGIRCVGRVGVRFLIGGGGVSFSEGRESVGKGVGVWWGVWEDGGL
jgi:hypothetical protein